jgi:hypothetical protein
MVTLAWSPPPVQNGAIVRYTIAANNSLPEVTVPGSQSEVNLTGLSPATAYALTMRAFTSLGGSVSSEMLVFTTLEAGKEGVGQGPNAASGERGLRRNPSLLLKDGRPFDSAPWPPVVPTYTGTSARAVTLLWEPPTTSNGRLTEYRIYQLRRVQRVVGYPIVEVRAGRGMLFPVDRIGTIRSKASLCNCLCGFRWPLDCC